MDMSVEGMPMPAQDRSELEATAHVFELILQANPADVGALEALQEIYAKLGQGEELAAVGRRLADLGSGPRMDVAAVPAEGAAPAEAPAPSRRRLPRLGDLLVAEGLISPDQLQHVLKEQRSSGDRMGTVLVRMGFLTEDQLVSALSRQYGLEAIALSQLDVDPEVLRLVPVQIARKYQVLPIRRSGGTLTLAMGDPTNVHALDDVGFMTNLQIMPVVAAPGAIRQALERLYEAEGGGLATVLSEVEQSLGTDMEVMGGEEESWSKVDVFELRESADEAPVVRLVNMILADAIRRGASDVHFEPYEKVFRVRFRVDGVLHEIMTPPKRLEAALTSRMKIMAALDIAERRLPQDGRI